jgi:flagellar motility protein MotE (MotC chaperone)
VPGQDEPRYDLTAAAEDVVRWVESLSGRDFVATQSRLTSIFAVLKALVQQSETDPEVRLAELQRQRDGVDAEMQRIRHGDIKVMTAPEALDHFQQLTTLAKDLLSDFREVEQNFRKLDRQVREQIATWDGTQGELLASIFANRRGGPRLLRVPGCRRRWQQRSGPWRGLRRSRAGRRALQRRRRGLPAWRLTVSPRCPGWSGVP